jgi:hypothetical protein
MLHLSDLHKVHYEQRQFHTFRNTQRRTGDSGEFGERRINMD